MTNDWLFIQPLCPCPETASGGMAVVPIEIIGAHFLIAFASLELSPLPVILNAGRRGT